MYCVDLNSSKRATSIGNKAAGLRFLARHGFRVPKTWVCTWNAYERFQVEPAVLLTDLKAELMALIDADGHYAVRSSANIEDDLGHSLAGQLATVLDVHGMDDLLAAICQVWRSASKPSLEAYLSRLQLQPADLKLAIIIQAMVAPVISGVSFSRNPMTGLDEVLVEAVHGSGTALVQEGATPDRWVHKWGTWAARPPTSDIPQSLVERVVDQTKEISVAYGQPVDLEWVSDGRDVYWVQIRPITTLQEINIYSNRIAREVLPGQIKPLVWSVNVPLVNSAWIRLFTEMIGPTDLDPNSLSKAFHYQAYFNMGVIGRIFEELGMPRDSLELLMGIDAPGQAKPSFRPSRAIGRHMPRLVRFLVDKGRIDGRVERFVSVMSHQYRDLQTPSLELQDEEELLRRIGQIQDLTSETAYYNIVVPLLMNFYDRLLVGQLNRLGVAAEQLNITAGMSDLQELDPNTHLVQLHARYMQLDEAERAMVRSGAYQALQQRPSAEEFLAALDRFLDRFGHLSNSGNDFSSVPWRESPELVLQMIAGYSQPAGSLANRLRWEDLDLPAITRPFLKRIYGRARRFRLYREQISSLYTYGYGQFRGLFRALGRGFAVRGLLAEPDDIFYLYLHEVKSAAAAGSGADDYRSTVEQRRREMVASQGIRLPTVIFGDTPPPLNDSSIGDSLTGTPASQGYYRGPVRVITAIESFHRLQQGDVLVIPYSDVGWSPLFTKAGALIAEAGGILSHSSIVAREYGIPAVVSVTGACRLSDDTMVTVDGYTGRILVHNGKEF